jgi:hypothetical protein
VREAGRPSADRLVGRGASRGSAQLSPILSRIKKTDNEAFIRKEKA